MSYYYVPTAIPNVASDLPTPEPSIPLGTLNRMDVSTPTSPLFCTLTSTLPARC